LADNIALVFGSKFLNTLIPVRIISESILDAEVDNEEKDNKVISEEMVPSDKLVISNQNNIAVCIEGYISKAGLGVGRNDNDRQFIYCNGRPIDMSKATRLLNDVSTIIFYATS
jgi:DNA mismatch repair ATPase MutL